MLSLPHSRERRGACLAHGPAHHEDHARWSRRDFLSVLGASLAGAAFHLGPTPVQAFGRAPLLDHLAGGSDRILVLIQLSGGNDGLNTVVPIRNDRYYQLRPSLAIAKEETVALTPDLGLHPSLAPLQPLYDGGRMAVVQGVGYPEPNLSHFRSTDIWLAGQTDGDVTSGWVGRYLSGEVPEPAPTSATPLAVQIGGTGSMLLQGEQARVGMTISSVDIFNRIAEEGVVFETAGLPPTRYGAEVAYLRTVANESFAYAESVQAAASRGRNDVDYERNPLSNNLAVIARLIKGRLGSNVYHVSLGGFDTHAGQPGQHATRLGWLATSVRDFLADLAADGVRENVLVMTFSEFGRRPQQNGNNGTDHGTAAPLFLFGDGVRGGLHGDAPDLVTLDPVGNLYHTVDFRSVYGSLMSGWFGLDAAAAGGILGGAFPALDLVAPLPTATEGAPVPGAFRLEGNYPNPFNPQTTIAYTLDRPGHIRLDVLDVQGRRVRTLVDGVQPAGTHRVDFHARRLPSGTYLYRLETPAGTQSRAMTLVR